MLKKFRNLLLVPIGLALLLPGIIPGLASAAFEAGDVLGHLKDGNPSFTLNGANNVPNDQGFNTPTGIAVDAAGRRVFISDFNNYRVLVFPLTASGTFATNTPSYVLGQEDAFSTGGEDGDQTSAFARDLAYDPVNDRLFVAEGSHNRIMVYDVASGNISNNENASFVMGQEDFSTRGSGTSSSTLADVQALAYDSVHQRLFAAEGSDGNHRILVFDVSTSMMANGKSASFVLGQPDFDTVTNSGVVASTTIDNAEALAYDPADDRLFAADTTGHRVLVFDLASLATNMPASFVLGQPDFDTFTGQPVSSNTISDIAVDRGGLAYDAGSHRLFVSDGNRVLAFDAGVGSMADNKPASFVLGQPDFTTTDAGTSSTTLQNASHLAFDATGSKLLIVDQGNNRILSYDTSSLADGEPASDVLGHLVDGSHSFVYGNANNGPGTGSLDSAQDSVVDEPEHRLFVSDTNNNRVLVFDLDSSNNPVSYNASFILGQPDAFTSDGGTSADKMQWPRGMVYDSANQRLFVVENDNNRISIFNAAPGTLATGMSASLVLGQSGFGINNPGTASTSLSAPSNAAYDPVGQRLFVSDTNNNRVLVFDAAPGTLATGMSASLVLGQQDFDSGTSGTSSSTMSSPVGVAYATSTSQLFVADKDNNRVLVFDAAPGTLATGMSASLVLGQPDFDSSTPGNSITAIGIPHGLVYDSVSKSIYVNDIGNNRVMVYTPIKIVTQTLPDATVGQFYSQGIDTQDEQGTVSFNLAGGVLPPGMTIGSVDGTPTSPGTYTFKIQAADSVAQAGFFSDDRTFTLSVVSPAEAGNRNGGNRLVLASGGTAPVSSTPSAESLQAEIVRLSAQVAALRVQLGLAPGTAAGPNVVTSLQFTRDLTLGSTGDDVRALQQFLNTHGFILSVSGPGSPGQETAHFGLLTKAALMKFQEAHGITPPRGYFGPLTRAAVNATSP